ncbi:MAG: hypothetical protein IPK32_18420 [Verrucomicrobiaceae bacterium]|nr:hypothetical protein [Verrucomicrobiaceae bacterium]
MKTPAFIPAILLITASALPAREFTDTQGRKLDAEIVAAAAGQVTLQRVTDKRTFAVPVTTFSEADQKFITEWAASNTKYSFDVTYTKKKLNETKTRRNNTTYEEETWVYKINIKNRLPAAVGDLRLDYWCFRRADSGKGKGSARIETSGSSNIPAIAGASSITLDTSEIILSKQKLDGGFYYINGENAQQSDAVGGLAVRIFDKNGKEVHKWATKDDLLAAAVGKPTGGGSNSEKRPPAP